MTRPSNERDTTLLPEQFMQALREIEQTKKVDALVKLFDEKPELLNLTRPLTHLHHSAPNAAESSNPPATSDATNFWSQYLGAFEFIESHFTDVIDDGNKAVMEWVSKGRLAAGVPIEYRGVSVIEYTDGKVQKFRTYYDSAAFISHTTTGRKPYSNSVGTPDIGIEATS